MKIFHEYLIAIILVLIFQTIYFYTLKKKENNVDKYFLFMAYLAFFSSKFFQNEMFFLLEFGIVMIIWLLSLIFNSYIQKPEDNFDINDIKISIVSISLPISFGIFYFFISRNTTIYRLSLEEFKILLIIGIIYVGISLVTAFIMFLKNIIKDNKNLKYIILISFISFFLLYFTYSINILTQIKNFNFIV